MTSKMEVSKKYFRSSHHFVNLHKKFKKEEEEIDHDNYMFMCERDNEIQRA